MTPETLSLFSDVLGLLGSFFLAIPAYRYSRKLELVAELQDIYVRELEAGSGEEERAKRVRDLNKKHASTWNAFNHYALMIGIFLLIAAFALKLLSH